ncbi:MAG: DUF2318 domain-containing protein [Fusobacteriaceae bacterium]|jgi:uncharacterized membrane protein|nr:DUF2318 domain-containing protein [Fusobacteriaceae bacterium]
MKKRLFGVTIALLVVLIHALAFTAQPAFGFLQKVLGPSVQVASKDGEIPVTKDADLIIPVAEVTENARFYPVEIEGTKLEVIAVRASDGTIRTAFNTCQVCYASGRGYYVQQGKYLVCQNCGNRFGMDQVEVRSGGCNPLPIFPQYKEVNDREIKIKKEFFSKVREIFANWKN